MKGHGPTLKRGKSSGDIWTPQIFIDACVDKFGPLTVDLAASAVNSKAPYFYSQADNALAPDKQWRIFPRLCWLNPPFANITPWVRKCVEEWEHGWKGLVLIPGSIGAAWYWQFVEAQANVYSVGRMRFDNCFDEAGEPVTTEYAKDLILCHYDRTVEHVPMQRWLWKEQLALAA